MTSPLTQLVAPKHFAKQSAKDEFRLFPFGSPLLGEYALARLFSFPPLTEMFHFSGCALRSLMYQSLLGLLRGVFPFGHPRITGC
jgi:hypothetical protein